MEHAGRLGMLEPTTRAMLDETVTDQDAAQRARRWKRAMQPLLENRLELLRTPRRMRVPLGDHDRLELRRALVRNHFGRTRFVREPGDTLELKPASELVQGLLRYPVLLSQVARALACREAIH